MIVVEGLRHCTFCKKNAPISQLSDFSYGDFILRTVRGEERCLEAFKEPAFLEIRDLIKLLSCNDKNNQVNTNALHNIISWVADKSDEGHIFTIGLIPPCIKCGSESGYEITIPEPTNANEIKAVSFTEWNTLTKEDKLNKVRTIMKPV